MSLNHTLIYSPSKHLLFLRCSSLKLATYETLDYSLTVPFVFSACKQVYVGITKERYKFAERNFQDFSFLSKGTCKHSGFSVWVSVSRRITLILIFLNIKKLSFSFPFLSIVKELNETKKTVLFNIKDLRFLKMYLVLLFSTVFLFILEGD